ncbi:uncharacterized protein TRAVEDRAFT_65747 [Trametes versicolor FP-101664 SS1]|uniref:uncharacterized protein n=1 Tax=Trametes versicolor (strain FP-101664) TaxID=717944 RepID=UPI0004621DD8|nr:uncharacterized protein TRAVEDRAFT_65747 [Trametes versicolor FP-101664 SS1]EIW56641.1 hypothetical protein TRAVEDRAFT_65747 [Trametes versicolor FP-101664 SS1]
MSIPRDFMVGKRITFLDRPSPKKRKLMHTPDGFENSKCAAGKAPARKFASAFDDPKRSKASTTKVLVRPVRPPPVAGPSKEASASSGARASRIPAAPKPVAESSSRPAIVQSRHASILAAHRNSSPAPPKPPPKPISKGSIQQFQPVLPPPAPPKDPPRNLRPMQPPPQPTGGRPKLDPTKMKTILTTRVAVAMDPRTESGTDELLGIYLEQNTGTHVPPAERELQRGLKQSPEKASKSKSAKFTRGGLAERAQRIFAKHNTTLGLWYKDMELQTQRPQAHPRIAPDLCLRIIEVLHVSSVASLQCSQSVPRLCVARCLKISPGGLGEPEEVAAVLDFGNPGSAAARAHTLDDVKMDRTLHIWRPWNTAKVQDSPNDIDTSLFRLPAHCSILFCTRFRIVS